MDGVLAVGAGGVTSGLSLTEQKKIDTVLLTHHHFDHARDLVTLAANAGHRCPRLVKEELIQFRRLKGYLRPVIAICIGTLMSSKLRKK